MVLATVAVAGSLGMQYGGSNLPLNTTGQTRNSGDVDRMRLPDEEPYVTREIQARQMKRLREEHQKEVFSDADRLVELATSLKHQADQGKALSLDAIKDADEIGKLAKRVSDRIKTQ